MAEKSSVNQSIDEGLYSRQLYAIGHEAMQKMSQANILICGLSGLGVEIAKNIILSGVRSVTLCDPTITTTQDMENNYYIQDAEMVGRIGRAHAVRNSLAELNSYVDVKVLEGNLHNASDEFLKGFTVVILTQSLLNEQVRVNRITHKAGNCFINCCSHGLFGQIFCDFGDNFVVTDQDGEQPKTAIIESLTKDGEDNKLVVRCVENQPHGLTNDSCIKFVDIEGVDEQVMDGVHKIQCVDKLTLKVDVNLDNLGDLDNFKSGEICEVKQSTTFNFKPLEQSMDNPEFVITSFVDFDRPGFLHGCYLAVNEYKLESGGYPTQQDYKTFESLVCKYLKKEKDDLEEKETLNIKKFIHCLNTQLTPVNSVIGGTVAQEALKGCSGKFSPVYQWLYFDQFSVIPDTIPDESVDKTRYSSQSHIFGREFQEKMESQRYFIVGAGAIGCELLKNFAMIGLGCGKDGKITITDMDTIERSNLNRQFLFRNDDIGKCKSVCASDAIKKMNPDVNIESHENRVGVETESVYSPQFYKELTGVANALDNVQARLYMDAQCVRYSLSLLESGTLGTKGNVQVVVPHLTESYGSSQDPPEQDIPVCTLKNFPYEIAHTIQYARDQFEGLFDKIPNDILNYLKDPEKLKSMTATDIILTGRTIQEHLENIPQTFSDCLKMAFDMWHKEYRDQIIQLLHKFPSDHLTDQGTPFWSGTKRCPQPLEFDPTDDLHLDFVVATGCLLANIFDLPKSGNTTDMDKFRETVRNEVAQFTVKDFVPDDSVQISVTEEEEKARLEKLSKMSDPDEIIKSMPNPSKFSDLIKKMTPQEFEKDDDTNFHIDFVTAASNLRAMNYGIKPVTRHKTKGIAGKIIPALATTTSVVAGLVTLELYKLIRGFDDIESYSNSFINLALPFFGFSEPMKTPVTQYKDHQFTIWDCFEMGGDITLQQLLDYFEEKDIELDFVNYGTFMFYSNLLPQKRLKEKLGMKIKDIIEEGLETTIDRKMITLTVGAEPEDDDEDEIDLPEVKLVFI